MGDQLPCPGRLCLVVVCRQRIGASIPSPGDEGPRSRRERLAERVTGRPDRAVGGVQAHADAVIDYFVSQGHEVIAVTPFQASQWVPVAASIISKVLAPLSSSLNQRWRRRWHSRQLGRALDALAPRLAASSFPVVIDAQDPLTAGVALTGRRAGAVVVLTVHNAGSEANDLWWDDHIQLGDRLYRELEHHNRAVLSGIDGFIPVAGHGLEGLLLHAPMVRSTPHCVLPNFLPDDWAGEPVLDTIGRRDLVTIGTLSRTKNHRFLLEVLAAARELGFRYRLTIIGEGPMAAELKQQWRDLRLEDQVEFLGARGDVPDLLALHRAYIHASFNETFGIVLIEAMAAGLPILAAPVGAIPEVFSDGDQGRYLPLDSAEDAARVLIDFLEDAGTVEHCGKAARDRFEQEYCASVVGMRMEQFFGELVAGSEFGRSRG
ncbi:MAG: glycosyltransferase family 4 protein [Acidimicrobiales bacterium]